MSMEAVMVSLAVVPFVIILAPFALLAAVAVSILTEGSVNWEWVDNIRSGGGDDDAR